MYRAYVQDYSFRVPTLTSEIVVFPGGFENKGGSVTVPAVWDTGATKTFISLRLSEQLDLIPIGFQHVISATGDQMAGLIDLSLKLPNGLFIPDKRAFICALPKSIDILIGMDIIQLGDLHISNANGKTLFSFVIPSLPTSFNLADEADRLNQH